MQKTTRIRPDEQDIKRRGIGRGARGSEPTEVIMGLEQRGQGGGGDEGGRNVIPGVQVVQVYGDDGKLDICSNGRARRGVVRSATRASRFVFCGRGGGGGK